MRNQYKAVTPNGHVYWVEYDPKIFTPVTETRVKPKRRVPRKLKKATKRICNISGKVMSASYAYQTMFGPNSLIGKIGVKIMFPTELIVSEL